MQIFELFDYPFFVNALIGVVLISISAAIIGTYIISRRLVAISGGVTHACFGGLGLGYFLGINPVVMAAVFAVASSAGVEWLSSRYNVREDSAIAVVWSLGMAVGVLFVFLTPGYVPELNSFLFGNILTISVGDLLLFGGYTAVLVAFFALHYRHIIACAFDRDFAATRGLPVKFTSYAMTVMVAVCIVLTIRLVGIMLLMSVFSLPMMTAEIFSQRYSRMTLISVGIALVAGVSGLMLGTIVDVPCSAIIVIILAVIFVVSRLIKAIFRDT
ncbi:MAG: metal ABC transporter permease, partial [Muribaculaceae bacterium]